MMHQYTKHQGKDCGKYNAILLGKKKTNGIDGNPKQWNGFKQGKIHQLTPVHRVHCLARRNMASLQKADLAIISTHPHQGGVDGGQKTDCWYSW